MGISLRNSSLFAQLNNTNKKLKEELERRVKIQQELETAMELAQAAVVSKNQFLANMSHELRTPLNAIIGITSLLIDTKLTGKQVEWLKLITASGRTLLYLVDDLLDLEKMAQGNFTVTKEKCDLHECIAEALDMLVHSASKKNIIMYCNNVAYKPMQNWSPDCRNTDVTQPVVPHRRDSSPEFVSKPKTRSAPAGSSSSKHLFDNSVVPKYVITDGHRVRQILLNLLGNAIKFTPPEGMVFLDVSYDRVNFLTEVSPIALTDTPHVPPPKRYTAPSTKHFFRKSLEMQTSMGLAIGDPEGSYDLIRFMVRDTGPGVSLDLAQRLFQPFTQGDATFSRKTGGAGLGLSICKQLVHLLGGQISVDIASPVGATMRFTLLSPHVKEQPQTHLSPSPLLSPRSLTTPASPSPPVPAIHLSHSPRLGSDTSVESLPRLPVSGTSSHNGLATMITTTSPVLLPRSPTVTPPVSPPLHPLRLLVAEDNLVNQKLVIHMLKRMGYTPDIANDGLEALKLWRTNHYDVILMDLQMPNMDGLTATSRIFAECDSDGVTENTNDNDFFEESSKAASSPPSSLSSAAASTSASASAASTSASSEQQQQTNGDTTTPTIAASHPPADVTATPPTSTPPPPQQQTPTLRIQPPPAPEPAPRRVLYRRPQIVAVTANVYDSDRAACTRVGMCDFVSKPLQFSRLKNALDQCQKRLHLQQHHHHRAL
eukprot:TRINITY_DN2092_c0_g3_i1.p1 TRINITY_DN2092_c0_g3~~TRINITY_DN2092_c0_g3_i1.p1  ORF type:complete len:823 (-),score=138.47 TRINITY_DN2092_c0_g3_i1:15-2150(-)